MSNIHEWGGKIKLLIEEALTEWGLYAVVFLVGLGSFGIGRLSALSDDRPAVSVFQAPVATEPRRIVLGGFLVASRTGTAYYYPWCAGAAKITPPNQRWFSSEAEARAAGYVPAKNCLGLQ